MAIEAALLIEEGYGDICDEIWYVYTSEEHPAGPPEGEPGLFQTHGSTEFCKSQLSDEAVSRANCDGDRSTTGISLDGTKEQVDRFLQDKDHEIT